MPPTPLLELLELVPPPPPAPLLLLVVPLLVVLLLELEELLLSSPLSSLQANREAMASAPHRMPSVVEFLSEGACDEHVEQQGAFIVASRPAIWQPAPDGCHSTT